MTSRTRTIAFDADDTLWHNERFFVMTQAAFADLLRDHAEPGELGARLEAAERRNIGQYGYGIKGFVLSMIETAVEVTQGRVTGDVIRALLEMGQDMLRHPIELLPHAAETVTALSAAHHIVLITKGDLLDQERKLAQSGLGDLFDRVEIVSDKTAPVYRSILATCPGGAPGALMVGNSMRSDILPALQAGAAAAHVPHDLAWALEHAEAPDGHPKFHRLRHLGDLPGLVESLQR